MKLKTIFILLFLFIIFKINTSELRLKSMGGISSLNLYVVPDTWCDSFFVNPAYAPENNKILINIYDNFNINMAEENYYQDSDDYSYKWKRKLLDFSNIFTSGMLIPINYFSFGFDMNYNLEYYKYKYDREEIDDDDKDYYDSISVKNYHNIDSNILFSWKVKDNFNIGFLVGVESDIYNYEGNDSDRNIKTPLNINLDTNFGILYKLEKLCLSISLPVSFNYIKNEIKSSYYLDKYLLDISTGTGYLRNIFDVSITDKILFRIPLELGFGYSYYREEFKFDSDYQDNIFYCYKKFNIPIKCAFSVNNKINEKVLIFYGLDFNFEFYTEYEYEGDANYSHNENYYSVESNIGVFIGGEFKVLKWFDIRTGINTIFLEYVKYKKYNSYGLDIYGIGSYVIDEDKYIIYRNSIQFLINANITAGFAFKPTELLTIELASNFLIMSPGAVQEESQYVSEYDYSSQENFDEYNFTVGFDLGFEIKIGKKDQNEDEEVNEEIDVKRNEEEE